MSGLRVLRWVSRPRTASTYVKSVVLVIGAGVLTAVPLPATAAGGPAHAVRGTACPDVMVLAARGSSEPPQGTGTGGWPFPESYRDPNSYYGAGQVNVEVFDGLSAARPELAFSLDSVMYPADAVPSRFQDAGA